MFSAYVVRPVPPPDAEIMVATASPRNARPRYLSRLRPVIAPTALIWPRFSATRMIATGAIKAIAPGWKLGVVKFGRPIQAALLRLVKSIGLPRLNPLAKIR